LIDLSTCTDIDAAGRFVDEDDLRLDRQPFAERDLLLIAAAKHTRLGIQACGVDGEFFSDVISELGFDGALHPAEFGDRAQRRR